MKTLLFLGLLALAFSSLTSAQAATTTDDELEKRVTKVEKKVSALQDQQEISRLKSRVYTLEQKIAKVGDQGLVLILFGAVCALWAQNTGRNSWLWFFLGLFFSIITVLVLLWKNADDLDRRRRASRT